MAARTQTTFYPSNAPSCLNIAASGFCATCNTSQDRSCCTSTGSQNSGPNAHACASICNSCQNVCNSPQNYCAIGRQKITSHADTKPFPTFCMVTNEIIIKNWTAVNWNTIIANLQTAYGLGRLKNQGNAPKMTDVVGSPPPQSISQHPANSLVTAEKYNEIVAALKGFVGTSLSTVNVEDVIKGTHAKAQETNYNGANFSTSVCDICNSSPQFTSCPCSCDCSCACDCSCGCSCPCNCNCSCSCTCSCSSS